MDTVVAVTGHRPDKLGGYYPPNIVYDAVKQGLKKAFQDIKPKYVITGMALGVDQWAAEVCLEIGIPFVAAIPFRNQESKWPPYSQAKYQQLLAKANNAFYISKGEYAPEKMQIRNQWMVNEASIVVAVWDGSTGGTANCIGYAHSVKREIYMVTLQPAIWDAAKVLAPKKPKFFEIGPPGVPLYIPPTNYPLLEMQPTKVKVSSFVDAIKEKAKQNSLLQLQEAKDFQKAVINSSKLKNIKEDEALKKTLLKKLELALYQNPDEKKKLEEAVQFIVENGFTAYMNKEQSLPPKVHLTPEAAKEVQDKLTYKRVMDLDD